MRDRRGERVVYFFILIDRERGLESGLVLRVGFWPGERVLGFMQALIQYSEPD